MPVGVLLSGGVDSCMLAALAAEETSEPLRTFSIGFEERSFDELADARLVAERYGTVHRELVLRPDAALLLPELAEAFDEPFADSSALPTYLVSQLAAEDVKVAMSGEGGDELFGGYYTYPASLLAERLGGARLARCGHSSSGCRRRRARRASTTARSGSSARRSCRRSSGTTAGRRSSPRTRARSSPAGVSAFDPVDLLRERFAETEGADLLARLQDVDIGTYLVDDLLVKTDRASMANSLEARVPFLDTVVSGFALALPARHKVRGLSKKRLLRKAAEPLLPAAHRQRPQARLLDPGRGVAARRARAVRARDALGGRPCAGRASSGPSPCGASSTSTSPAGRTGAGSSGACSRSRSGTSTTWSARPAAK